MGKRAKVFGILSFSIGTALTPCYGAENERIVIEPRLTRPKPGASIRVDTNLVLIPVTVTDSFGAPYAGLPREAFHLFEDGIEQPVRHFTTEDAPVTAGVVFDASLSMRGKLEQSRNAMAHFFRTAAPGDEYFLIQFNDAPRLLCNFTSDSAEIEKTLAAIQPSGWTALFDAIYLAVHQMKRARNPRKVFLILSDGGDNNSRYTESELKALLRERDVCLYAIGLTGGATGRNARVLRQLSEETGGQFYEVKQVSDLPQAVEKISRAIRYRYLLGYSPGNQQKDGLFRKIQVKLDRSAGLPPLHATWRAGYYAPAP